MRCSNNAVYRQYHKLLPWKINLSASVGRIAGADEQDICAGGVPNISARTEEQLILFQVGILSERPVCRDAANPPRKAAK
jgi:hypothetical protein